MRAYPRGRLQPAHWGMRKNAALLLGALLVGCGSPGPGTPGTSTVSGNVLLPDRAVTAQAGGAETSGTELDRLPPQALDALWRQPHVRGEVLVALGRPGALGAQALDPQALAALAGVEVQAVPGTGLQRALTPAGEDDAAFARRLAAAGVPVQPNFIYRALAVPNDPGFPAEGHPGVKVGGTFYDQDYLTRIDALGGWNRLATLGRPVDGALTAVLDTGVDRSHPELAGRLKQGFDFCARLVGDSCQGSDNVPDEVTAGDVGHGTSAAGLIAANTNNGIGIASLTWRGTVLPVKVFGSNGSTSSATSASLTAGVNYAREQGAKVINMSLGFAGQNGQAPMPDPALQQAIQKAASAGAVLVAAAGNTKEDGLYYPASDPNVLAVGAAARDDTLACFSARPLPGQKPLDLVAPGGQAGTGAGNCYTTSPYDILTLAPVSRGSYTLRAGTSEAAPQVSGAAALLRAAFPGLTASQVKQALKEGARPTSAGAFLNVLGAVDRANALAQTPPPGNRSYSLTVQARRGGEVAATQTKTGTLSSGQRAVPYTLGGLPTGTYVLHAELKVAGQTYSGDESATVSGGRVTKDIQTQ